MKSTCRYFAGPRARALATRPPAAHPLKASIMCDCCGIVWHLPVVKGINVIDFPCTCGASIHGTMTIRDDGRMDSKLSIEKVMA